MFWTFVIFIALGTGLIQLGAATVKVSIFLFAFKAALGITEIFKLVVA